MEDLASFAVMASASVGLYKELFLDERLNVSSRDSGFVHSPLAALRRQEDEDDDTTIALLSTIWQNEVIANLAASEVGKSASNDSAAENGAVQDGEDEEEEEEENVNLAASQLAASPCSSFQRPAKRSKTAFTSSYEEFGLRLNLDTSHYGVPSYTAAGTSGEFFPGDGYRVHHQEQQQQHFVNQQEDPIVSSQQQQQQRRIQQISVLGALGDHAPHLDQLDDHDEELALRSEHAFMTTPQHHYARADEHSRGGEEEEEDQHWA